MYCSSCLKQMLEKLNSNDVTILELFVNEEANLPQCSLSWDTVVTKITTDKTMTSHNVYTSIKRLNEFGFLDTQKWMRKNKYYITSDGINILNLFAQKLN